MRASSIRIDRLRESDVGRVVARDHALRVLDGDDGLRARVLVARILEPAIVGGIALPHLEAAFDVDRGAAALDRFAAVISRRRLERHAASLPSATANASAEFTPNESVDNAASEAPRQRLIHNP